MIGAALRKILLRRTGVEGGVAPSGRRKGNRAVILCVLLAGLLVMRPEPAQACCDANCPGAYLCDPFTVPCAAIAAFEAFATIVANLVIYIEVFVNPAIVDAAHGLGSKAATALQATMLSNKEVAHAASKQKTFWDMYLADKKLTIDNLPNTGEEQCRLETTRLAAGTGTIYQQEMVREMDRASTALAVNPVYNTQRMQMSATQRYCKNGMLTRASMGNTAFDKMECFEDPIYADAYIQAGRILDHLVLVPPSSAPRGFYLDGKPITDMSILDNPDDPANPLPAKAVWDGLTDKQKDYVAALRYCQHMEQSALQVTNFNSDQAATPDNMRRITGNFSAIGMLQTLANVCYSELARRTAPNVYDAADPAMASPAMTLKRETDPLIAEQLVRIQMTPLTWMAYRSFDLINKVPAGPPVGEQVFISPALYQLAKYHAYCTDRATAYHLDMDSGNEATIYNNKMKCENIVRMHESLKGRYAELFAQAGKGMKAVGMGFMPPTAAPVKVENEDGAIRKVNMSGGNGGGIVPLSRLIRKMDREDNGRHVDAAIQ